MDWFEAYDGNFYGTTRLGGDVNGGTAFRLTPSGTVTTLASFNYTNGYWPAAGLMQGADGNLYGTTAGMLSANYGTAFRITTNGALTTLVFFNNTNGATPLATLIQASDASLYGTTTSGGAYGSGTVFRISPDGTLSTIYSFSGTNDGVNPHAELVQATDGNFYGVTSLGGLAQLGQHFQAECSVGTEVAAAGGARRPRQPDLERGGRTNLSS